MDRLEAMSVLLAVVDEGTLSAAARRLGTPLTTVSRKVADLEAHLGTRLMIRTSRRISLTDAGRTYVAACRRIVEEVDDAERAAAGEYSAPRGELVVTAPIVFGRLHVLPVITELLARHPAIDARLTLADRVVNLVEEHIDVAVRIGTLPDSSLMATTVGSVRRGGCASPDYLASHGGAPKQPADLAGHACVTFEGLTSPDAWIFGRGKATQTVPIRSRLVVNTAEAAIDAAVAGVGLTRVLSYQMADALAAGRLVAVLESFEPEPSPVNLVYGGRGLVPQKTRAFVDLAAARLRRSLQPGT